jgi:FAD/FMN-containing dehydrogenase
MKRFGPSETDDLLAPIRAALTPDELIVDPAICALWATDIFHEGSAPLAILRPVAKSSVPPALAAANAIGLPVVPRGGGLSYSAGALPDAACWIGLDTRSLEDIIAIDPVDMHVTVGAGCTWDHLHEALRPLGLRTPFWGPASGRFSTVCATLSQNAVLYGSGRYGAAADSVLGFELVSVDGRVLRTGSACGSLSPTPFFRHYGPDLTGLFIGDNGALAIKVAATLQLIHAPEATAFTAFEFADRRQCAAAMDEIGRRQLASECFAFDAAILARALPAADAAWSGPIVTPAAGRRYPAALGFRLDMAVEGRDTNAVESVLAEIGQICLAHGAVGELDSLLRLIRQQPFGSPSMMLTPAGDRWIPVHGIVPHSRHIQALDAIDDYMNGQVDILSAHGIEWGYSALLVGPSAVLIEPNLYWRDSRHALLESYFDQEALASIPRHPENLPARSAIAAIRSGLIETFQTIGAVHLQIGRLYPLGTARDHQVSALLSAIKSQLDPEDHLNPGLYARG